MDVAYVTRHTFKKLSGTVIEPAEDVSIDAIYSAIYEQSLRSILNRREAKRLYTQKIMIEGKFQSLRVSQKRFDQRYVFSVGLPKFHRTNECKYLTSDFSNVLIPPEVQGLGEEKLKEFQEFCDQNKKKFNDSPKAFWDDVSTRFRVQVTPQSVLFSNSGVQDVGNMTIEELRQQVNDKLLKSLHLIDSDNAVKNVRYASYLKPELAMLNDPEVKSVVMSFFDLKHQLIDAIFELYKKQVHADSYMLPVDFLKAAGLDSCRGCWK